MKAIRPALHTWFNQLQQPDSTPRAHVWLALILLVALILRGWGLNAGLPYTLYNDEAALVAPALKILQTGDFNPHRFDYGSLHVYLLALAYIPYFLYGVRTGVFSKIQDLPVSEDVFNRGLYPFPAVFLVGRLVSVGLSVLAVYWIYRVGTRVWDRRTGLVAAALLAVLPAIVRQSHFIVSDPSMNLLVLIALEVTIVAYRSQRLRYFLAAGLLAGLAASCKQTGAQLIGPLWLAAVGLAVPGNRRIQAAAVAAGGLIAGYLLGTPFAFLDLPNFLNWQAYVVILYNQPGVEMYEGPSWLWHLRFLFTSENALVLGWAIIGGLLTLRRQRWLGLIVLAFPALHALSMASQTMRYDRTWLPIAPFACLLAAYAIVVVAGALSARVTAVAGRARLITAAIVVALAAPLSIGSIHLGVLLDTPEVRLLAKNWIEQNLPRGTHLAVEYSRPPLAPNDWQLTRMVGLYEHDLDWYREQGIEYLVVSSAMAWNPGLAVQEAAWYQHLHALCEPLATIEGPGLGLPGRYFWIYDLNLCRD